MAKFFRLLKILHTIGRYRLDEMAHSHHSPRTFKLLLLLFKLYPKSPDNRGARIRRAFEELGPIFVKFGQLLSTRPDLIPDDIVAELDHLQDNVAPFSSELFVEIVERELQGPVDTLFKHFDRQPLASASVAQVHTAVLHSGEDVVIKVIRPGLEPIIEKDTQLLRVIARLIERFTTEGKRLRPVAIIDDYRETILDELDLAREGANASQLRRNFENSNMLYIPEVYWQYSTRNVLVLERLYGLPVTDTAQLESHGIDLKLLAERGVEVFFTQVFEHNFFHADMHPGNVFVSKKTPRDPCYMAVDMAIVGTLTREDQYYLARNLLAMFRRDYRQVAELHVLSGWVPRSTSIAGFEAAIRSVCEPIFEKPLIEISFGEALISLFKTAQRYQMPVQPQLVLLQKTLLNIEGLGRQLYPKLDLWDTAHPYLERWVRERFHPKTLFEDLKYHAPEWMEKFPQVPHLIFDTLSEVKTLAKAAPELKAASKALRQSQSNAMNRSRNNTVKIGAAACMFAGGYILLQAIPELTQAPRESLLLLAAGTLILFFKR
ncbi:ubiquinone biosynthesis regulatory protein kinase UbiB [Teredinibacter purpureus]|uniref:ubiquinone biosynthesis regulatory protein kinase UbiB n=1 Tax=Teredinibacter purpureus TaxID=2731756 RepID=UPI0005F7D7F4|nr:ubiquinone biosynthesis regulatory protein kinase UbiB [Teredinibacter purpureus]